jgi:asparagine synthase (glutamine-hydrolysing)
MRHRFIALVRSPAKADLSARFADRVRAIDGLEMAFENARVSVATFQPAPLLLHDRGIVLGSLFLRGRTRALKTMGLSEAGRVAASRGGELIARYWGPYVALVCDGEGRSVDVVRAPLGELPCYFVELDGATALASDVDLLVAFGMLTPVIDWTAVARHLLTRDLRGTITCLAGLHELPGGQRLGIAPCGCSREQLWSPWTFAAGDRQVDDDLDAARRLREVARECVAARASEFGPVVLMLSGGLDSSIVAACLAQQGLPVHCLTLVSADAIGDERNYARQVSRSLGVMLTEGFREVSRIDLMHSEARRLPRPTARAFLQESRRLAAAVAAETGAGAIFNGGGGDNVFCSLRSSGPAADRLLTAGPGAEFLRTARAIGELAPTSLWAVVSDAVRRAWLGKPALREVRDSALLSPRALEQAGAMEAHPWLDLPARALPGKAMHVRLLAFAQSFVEGFDPQDALPTVAPLLAQPLVEACLSVPSWSWFVEGRDRVIARRAFAGGLPVEILQRRSKGTPDSFVAEIFEKSRATLRAMLADGALAAHDMLDLPKVLRALDDPRPVHGDAFRRILQFADAEAWARAWIDQTECRPTKTGGILAVSNDTTSKQP